MCSFILKQKKNEKRRLSAIDLTSFQSLDIWPVVHEYIRQCECCCRYYETMRRRNYVTPTSYLELIKTFKSLLDHKRMEILTLKNRYIVGLEKLEFSESQVHTTGNSNSCYSKKKKIIQCSCTNIGIVILILVLKYYMKIDLWWTCCWLTGFSVGCYF